MLRPSIVELHRMLGRHTPYAIRLVTADAADACMFYVCFNTLID